MDTDIKTTKKSGSATKRSAVLDRRNTMDALDQIGTAKYRLEGAAEIALALAESPNTVTDASLGLLYEVLTDIAGKIGTAYDGISPAMRAVCSENGSEVIAVTN